MLQILQCLDDHNGAIMVIITFVYVIATIAICIANLRSAKATREQLEESKRQYEEEHRAFITYELVYLERMWYGLRLTNHGKRIANNVQLQLTNDFVDSIETDSIKNMLLRLNGKEFSLGIGQSYDIYFGGDDFRDRKKKCPIEGTILYNDRMGNYSEKMIIDFERYPPIFSVTTGEEQIGSAIKKMSKSTDDISHELQKLNSKLNTSTSKVKDISLFSCSSSQ